MRIPSPSDTAWPSYDFSSVPTPSTSSTLLASAQPTPTPPPSSEQVQDVLYVHLDGTSYQGKWPPESQHQGHSFSSRKGKRRADGDEGIIDARSEGSLGGVSPNPMPFQLEPRQDYPSCTDIGNDVLSCYPMENTTVYQDQWTKFIWNVKIPYFIGSVNVDIYLYHADTGELVESWPGVPNAAGQIPVQANDLFWDYRMTQWQPGSNIAYTYYFVIVSAGTVLDGGEPRQATWTAIQTAFADWVYTSESSVSSVASASRSSASASSSSASAASAASVAATANPGLQASNPPNSNSNFPGWAIALIVILGFLAFVAMATLAYLLLRHSHRKNGLNHRASMGSSTPIIAPVGEGEGPQSPTLMTSPESRFIRGGSLAIAGGVLPGPVRSDSLKHSNVNDGASARSVSDHGLFSGQDAAIMADAFRKALRKPDFADRPTEEGESPNGGSNTTEGQPAPPPPPPPPPDVLRRELEEEGHGLRSVSSVRGVTVQTPDDGSGLLDTGSTLTSGKPS